MAQERKQAIECVPRIDIRDLANNVLVELGSACDLNWHSSNGEFITTVTVENTEVGLEVHFRDGLGGTRQRQHVLFSRIPCHYGGYRVLLLCPSCEKRVVALYRVGMRFTCRHCNDLTYVARRRRRPHRMLERAQQLREELGGSRNLLLPFPGKPKNMHWATYRRMYQASIEAERFWIGSLADRLSP